MSILLNDREEATCRLALQVMLTLGKADTPNADYMRRVEVEELIGTMGPNSGVAFGESLAPDLIEHDAQQYIKACMEKRDGQEAQD